MRSRTAVVAPADATSEADEPGTAHHHLPGESFFPGIIKGLSTKFGSRPSVDDDSERITRESASKFVADTTHQPASNRYSRRPGFIPSVSSRNSRKSSRTDLSERSERKWSKRKDVKTMAELVASLRVQQESATARAETDSATDDLAKYALMINRGVSTNRRLSEHRANDLKVSFVTALKHGKASAIAEEPHEVQAAVRDLGEGIGLDADFRGSAARNALPVPVPKLHVVIMIVGTHGDVLPFCALGRLMQEKYGHMVRLATHEAHRHLVQSEGLLFYPLGGDPKILAGWAADFSCRPKHLIKTGLSKETPDKLAMQQQICESTWGACTMADPKDPHKEPFKADAIISNPLTYGHIHCAERLKVPLHMMFPQPWTPTHAYAHPFSGLSYKAEEDWTLINKNSYALVDDVMWHGMLPIVNRFRTRTLGLKTLRFGAFGGSLLNSCKVPFVKMWSPSFVPKPSDWPEEVDVAGSFFIKGKATQVDETQPERAKLLAWLAEGPPPIFVGFGSMVFDGDRATQLIVEAAKLAGCRVLMQSGWSKLGGDDASTLPPSCSVVGPCPHDWLLPKTVAVVHHGGAGTVAAGLKMGLPTMVCPFFGDQFFWGAMVSRAGVGPKPVPIAELTAKVLAESFKALRDASIKARATELAAQINQEDGVASGLDAFHRNLPLDDMVCDVLLWQSEPAIARHYYPSLRLKVSDEVHFVVATRQMIRTRKHHFKRWSVGVLPNPWLGVWSGFFGMLWELILTVLGLVLFPYHGAVKHGVKGFVLGIAKALVLLFIRPLYAVLLFFDRITTGITNMVSATWAHARGDRFVPRRYIIDPEDWFQVAHDPLKALKAKRREHAVPSIDPDRAALIYNSFRTVASLMATFRTLDRHHDGVLNLKDVKKMLDNQHSGKLQLPIEEQNLADFLETIDANKDGFITFDEFLLACRRFTYHLHLSKLRCPTIITGSVRELDESSVRVPD